MATSVASTNALFASPAPTSAPATNTSQARATGTDSPFRTVLTATRTQQTNTTNTTTATNATDSTSTDQVTPDATDQTDDNNDTTAQNSPLAGLLVFVTQILAPPENAAVAQATGQTALAAQAAQAAQLPVEAAAATLSRSEQLQLTNQNGVGLPNLTAGTVSPNAARTALATQTAATVQTNAANAANTQTTTTAVPTTQPEPTATGTPTPATAVPTPATFTANPGGSSSIPPQGQIVANAAPTVPPPADLSVTAPPVAEPTAPIPATALPTAQLGDRPATGGERFFAAAEAGAQLAAAGPPGSVVFANALAQEATGTGAPVLSVAAPPVTGAPGAFELTNRDRDTRSDTAGAAAPAPVSAGPQFPTAPAPAETTARPASPAVQIADSIVTHAHVAERNGGVEFQMRLDPPDLGRVQVRLVTRGDEVHGQVLVASEAVRGMIESQLPELRQRLEAAGVNVQQFDVSTGSGAGGNQTPYRDDTPREFFPRVPPSTGAPAPRARVGRPDAGSLDVTV